MNSTITQERFGAFGCRYVPETLIPALDELADAFETAIGDPAFNAELTDMLSNYVGRPSPLSPAPRLSEAVGARVYLKREDLNHTGAHKINNTVGQALLARRMGKRRFIAETGAGQHGVATATVCARFGLDCVVYMGEEDMRRQSLNVFRMRLMGAKVGGVSSGTKTLKDATTEAIRDWVTNVNDTYYVIGSVVGPAPYPRMVRDFQAIIGQEARAQMLERAGVLHGSLSYLLQDEHGQVHPAHSISAGLDYPGVGPEHSYLKDIGRAEYVSVSDRDALEGFRLLSRLEGIIPALETAHAVSWITSQKGRWKRDEPVLLCVSGRGDKDVAQVSEMNILGS